MSDHDLKTLAEPFYALLIGEKTFEFRRDDRPYAVGDLLLLREYDMFDGYSGRELTFRVTHLIRGEFGVPPGYVCMSIKRIGVS